MIEERGEGEGGGERDREWESEREGEHKGESKRMPCVHACIMDSGLTSLSGHLTLSFVTILPSAARCSIRVRRSHGGGPSSSVPSSFANAMSHSSRLRMLSSRHLSLRAVFCVWV